MRRTATILAVVALMVVSSSGVALAAYEVLITGTDGDDIISGTGKSEHISGLGGDDRLNGGSGADFVEGGLGSDELGDGRGRDTVNANGGADNLIGQGGDTSVDRFYADSGRDTSSRGMSPPSRTLWNAAPAQTPSTPIRPTPSETTASS
jgi:Ca2+-binding RTX toxin-like protein